ncbi:MAG: tetratricopeptide repeat protein, partial [Desulfobulbaceae bacterium]|nr:tetratricopeptide repeat protein [Desulfobulbaceae bacterium]
RLAWFAAVFVCGGLGLLSKENAAILPVLILVFEVYFLDSFARGMDWRRMLPWLVGGGFLLFVLARLYLGENVFSGVMAGYAKRDFTLGERLFTESRVIFLYLGLLLLPLPSRLNFCHDFSVSQNLFSPPQTALSILGLLALVGLAIYLFRRDRLASFAIVWFLAALIIESTIIPLELVFEHRLYLPSAFFFLPVVVYVYRFCAKFPRLPQLLLGGVIVFLAVCTWQRNVTWGSPIAFWSDVVKKSPQLARGYVNLGRRVEFAGNHQEAARLFRKAIALAPRDGRNYDNLGVVYAGLGRFAEAEKLFVHAFDINPGDKLAISNLGKLYSEQNRCEQGSSFFADALMLAGADRAAILAELASASRCLGKMAAAIRQAQQSLDLEPEQVPVRITLGIALYESGRFEAAMAQFRQAKEGGYDVVSLLLNAARHKLSEGRREEAAKVVRQVLVFEPGSREALRLLSTINGG